MQRIYLAGPEVFLSNAEEIGTHLKFHCKHNFCTGVFPLDQRVDPNLSQKEKAHAIVQGNMQLIQSCDTVMANLSNFRGSTIHPACDSGTAWECGYAIALGKTVIGYTIAPQSVPQEIINKIHMTATINSQMLIYDLFSFVNRICMRDDLAWDTMPEDKIIDISPKYDDILDADAYTAFLLGYDVGKNVFHKIHIDDPRPQIEKYGEEFNGYITENFSAPANIMITENATFV